MNNRMQTAACALLLGLLTVGFLSLRFAYSPGDFQEMIRRNEELRRLHQAMLHRRQLMQQAAQAYIAQRCTLAETMQRWQESEQELGQEWPVYRDILRLPPQLSGEERYYGGIMVQVETILRGQPEELAAVLRRLEKEYQQLRADRNRPSSIPKETTEPSR